jgi:MinD-like ATPase involved in chromosome partitioning or flagellar assembly
MIAVFKKIDLLKIKLEEMVADDFILNFHITLRLNNDIFIYLLSDETNDTIESFIKNHQNSYTEIKVISTDEQIETTFYQEIFKNQQNRINIKSSRRRFMHLLDEDDSDKQIDAKTSVITFYSYKGGLGRSTTLASFAMALANGAVEYYKKTITPQKVVIIDFDLEAPGFTNYFLKEDGSPIYHNGVVEYLTDIEYNTDIDIKQYIWEVSKENFAGAGEIWVMPAGNLNPDEPTDDFLKNNLSHYLEGLARLDISSPKYLVQQIKSKIIDKICETIQPNFILIDSRTGFNDIFGITALQLSKTMIGFFGSNAQTQAGLHFFVDTLQKHKHTHAMIVNAILPEASWRNLFKGFQAQVEYISKQLQENGDETAWNLLKIRRNPVLELIGTSTEDPNYFKDLILKREFGDYNELFDKIYDLSVTEQLSEIEPTLNPLPESETSVSNLADNPRIRILKHLQRELPHLYADSRDENGALIIDFQQELEQNRYFFRNCMQDLFNLSRFLVVGNKGTGKSYIYESLRNEQIVKALQAKANKPPQFKYHFFHLIETQADDKNKANNFFVDTAFFDSKVTPNNTEFYFYRFWLVFIWRSIMEHAIKLGYNTALNYFEPVMTSTQVAIRFDEIIKDDAKIVAIESDLTALNHTLNAKGQGNEYIVAIFDPLDKLIPPDKWKDRIAPLIHFWRRRPYSKIFSKLFVRKDLLNRIGNINNLREIVNQSISIEWTQEELFTYFFTLVCSAAHQDFFEIMRQTQTNGALSFVAQMSKKTAKKQQFPQEEGFLKLASDTFFGKYAHRKGNDTHGSPYDWIYKNLKNADDRISIRPFIDLLQFSIEDCLKQAKLSDALVPILPTIYFTKDRNRKAAVERYFNDLASEQGNNDLKYIFDFFETQESMPFRFIELNNKNFELFLNTVIKKYQNLLLYKDIKSLTDLLMENAIVKRNNLGYTFALLYKYRLGLKKR